MAAVGSRDILERLSGLGGMARPSSADTNTLTRMGGTLVNMLRDRWTKSDTVERWERYILQVGCMSEPNPALFVSQELGALYLHTLRQH